MRRTSDSLWLAVLAIVSAGCSPFSAPPESADAGASEAGTSASSGEAGADAGGAAAACLPRICTGTPVVGCHRFDFAKSCPPPPTSPHPPDAWFFVGDGTGVTHECVGGAAHLAADDTLDVGLELPLTSPRLPRPGRITFDARIALKTWNGRRMLRFHLGGDPVATVFAVLAEVGTIELLLCAGGNDDPCEAKPVRMDAERPHVFGFELSRDGVTGTLDCAPAFSLVTPLDITPSQDFRVHFGQNDAGPAIDGSIADVSVQL